MAEALRACCGRTLHTCNALLAATLLQGYCRGITKGTAETLGEMLRRYCGRIANILKAMLRCWRGSARALRKSCG
eukprot:2348690-Alexandrium_andersonii.AAC.1